MTGIFKALRQPKTALILVLILAALFRFYRLSDYLQFLGDEGRDALIVMHMITRGEWTLLGPTASVGGFYIGGLYYYFMLPFLWLWQLNPVGPAYMSALFGVGTIFLLFQTGKMFHSQKAGVIAAFLGTISPYLIATSRFSWNPNPIPFFTLATILCLYQARKTGKLTWTFLAAVSVGILQELHYLDLIFIPIFGLSLFLLFPNRKFFWHLAISVLGFLIGDSMFILFELRHNFPNTRSALEFIFRGTTIAPRSYNLISLFDDTSRMLFDAAFGFRGWGIKLLQYFSLGGFLIWIFLKWRQKENHPQIWLLSVWLILGVFGVGLYLGTLLPHYFSYLYPLPFLFLGLILAVIAKRHFGWLLVGLSLIWLTVVELPLNYLWSPPNNLLAQTQTVDKIVLQLAGNEPFNFALVTLTNSDHAYRYYLELWGKTPVTIENPQIDPQRKTVTGQLIAVCEQQNCAPLGNPLWEVAGFGRAEIAATVSGPAGIVVYKLVHYTGQ